MNIVIDISKWNNVNNYAFVKNSVAGAIIRCGYRGNTTGEIALDQKFAQHITNLSAVKCPVGIYFFTNAINTLEAKQEANFVISCIKNLNLKLSFPIFIDTEYGNKNHNGRADKLDKNTRTDVIVAFIEECRSQGYEAAIYASDYWYKDNLDYARIKKYKKWVAKYSTNPPIYATDNMIGWQKSSTGICSGISGNVDISEWYSDISLDAIKYIKEISNNGKPKFTDGQEVYLDNAPLYASSTTSKEAAFKTGKYYIWNSVKRSDRIRITNSKDNVGNPAKVTGWVKISDIK